MKINECPQCHGLLRVTRKRCERCGLGLEADFEQNPLALLSHDEQDFVLKFVLCGGNFRALSQEVGSTYPTLRAHLDRIIARLRGMSCALTAEDIVEAIDQGKLTPTEGAERLKTLRKEQTS